MLYNDIIITKYNINAIQPYEMVFVSLYSTIIEYVILKLIRWIMNYTARIGDIIQDINKESVIYDKLTHYLTYCNKEKNHFFDYS